MREPVRVVAARPKAEGEVVDAFIPIVEMVRNVDFFDDSHDSMRIDFAGRTKTDNSLYLVPTGG